MKQWQQGREASESEGECCLSHHFHISQYCIFQRPLITYVAKASGKSNRSAVTRDYSKEHDSNQVSFSNLKKRMIPDRWAQSSKFVPYFQQNKTN